MFNGLVAAMTIFSRQHLAFSFNDDQESARLILM